MSASHRTPKDTKVTHDPEPPTAAEASEASSVSASAPPCDWQVLLLRHLPQPVGCAHAVKRLVPR